MQPMDPLAVVKGFNEARNAHDLQRAMSFVADDAVFALEPPFFGASQLWGKQETRGYVQRQIADDFHIETSDWEVSGNTVRFRVSASADSYRQRGIDMITGKTQIAIQDGKITALTFRASPETVRKLEATAAVAQR
jgi:ketosteroid isomerase-like protein